MMHNLVFKNYTMMNWAFIGMLLMFVVIGMFVCSHFASSMITAQVPAITCMQSLEDCTVFHKEGSSLLISLFLLPLAAFPFLGSNVYTGYGGSFMRQVIRARNVAAKLNDYLAAALSLGILHPKTY